MKLDLVASFNKFKRFMNPHTNTRQNLRVSREILWAQVFNSAITSSKWFTFRSMNPGRWAMGYPGLYIIFRILNDIKPASILEFGLGESTKLTYQYIKSQEKKSLTIVEQDENWLNFFSDEIFNVQPYTVLLPLEEKTVYGKLTNTYQNLIPNINNKKYDFIIIDGPWGSTEYSRFQIMDIIQADLLDEDFIILMDDYNRKGERQTIEKVKELLSEKNIEFNEGIYSGEKQTFIICSKKYQFLTSL